MKNLIITLLRKGSVRTSKYTAEDLAKRFYPLRGIIRDCDLLGVRCVEDSPFWHPDNNDNRTALIHDLAKARLGDVRSNYYFILVRFEKGDRYGIPQPQRA